MGKVYVLHIDNDIQYISLSITRESRLWRYIKVYIDYMKGDSACGEYIPYMLSRELDMEENFVSNALDKLVNKFVRVNIINLIMDDTSFNILGDILYVKENGNKGTL